MENIVSNCPLCGEHSLHLSQDQELNFMQCISCGYVSSDKFKGTKDTNEEYKNLDELLQSWVQETENRLWIPIQMTLPFGMVYPALVDNNMKWIFAEKIEIPIQGGMNPNFLLLEKNEMLKNARKYLEIFKNHKYIFNLGHGVIPQTNPENVKILVDYVKEFK